MTTKEEGKKIAVAGVPISKKFTMVAVAGATPFVAKFLDYPPEETKGIVDQFYPVVMIYLGGQSAVDFVKKAKEGNAAVVAAQAVASVEDGPPAA